MGCHQQNQLQNCLDGMLKKIAGKLTAQLLAAITITTTSEFQVLTYPVIIIH